MKPLLFRLKIAVLSMLMSGIVVFGFALISLVTIGKIGIERVDNEIRALGEGQIHTLHPIEHWSDFNKSLDFIYGEHPTRRFLIRVLDTRREELFTSDKWPEELSNIEIPELDIPPHDDEHNPFGKPESSEFDDISNGDIDKRMPTDEFDIPPARFRNSDLETEGYMQAPGGPRHARFHPNDTEDISEDLPEMYRRGPRPNDGPLKFISMRVKPSIPAFTTYETPTGIWRVGFMGNESVTLIVAADLVAVRREAALLRNILLIGSPLALLILGIAGWILASRALRPVRIITNTAKDITARDLDRRISATSADVEFQQLVDVINSMLDRLEQSFHQAARFSADAAHELQTPLTVLQGELDNAVQHATAGSEEQQRYSGLLEEVQSLKTIVQKLLLLARADVGKLPLSLANVDLSVLVKTAVEDIEVLAPNMTIETDIPPDICITADAGLLSQIFRNMTSNVMKYGLAEGTVRFTLKDSDDVVKFTLANSATPIPLEDRVKIFNRFHRVDKARSRDAKGSGLGLSLAREIAHAHGGDIVLDPSHNNMVSFTLSLPTHISRKPEKSQKI